MIELEHITVGYDRDPILSDLSLRIADGGITVLLGPNGCGKSTLLKTAAGLLKPTAGTVRVDGKPLREYSGKELARRIAYLPQVRQLPSITVERMVLHGRFPYLGYPRRYSAADHAAAASAMEAVDLIPLRHRDMTTLSGGERQKVYIAMALAQETPTVLLDEPTTYLDIDRQLEVMRLSALLRDQGKTVVMVLHDLNLAFRYADTLHLMQKGRLVASGTPDALCASGALTEVFHVRTHRIELEDAGRQYIFY